MRELSTIKLHRWWVERCALCNLAEVTEKLIREEVHAETGDAEERVEPRRLGR